MSVTAPTLEYLQFDKHYDYVFVDSMQTKKIFDMKVDGNYVAFIQRIAFDWFGGANPPVTASIIRFTVDGFTREYLYEIPINKPLFLDPPIVARDRITIYVVNNDVPGPTASGKVVDGAHWYGVLCDGVLAKPKTS